MCLFSSSPPPHLASSGVWLCVHLGPAERALPSFLLFFPLHPGRGSQDAGKPHKTWNICSFFLPSLYSWKARAHFPGPVGLADSTFAFSRAIKRKGERRKRVAYWQDCF